MNTHDISCLNVVDNVEWGLLDESFCVNMITSSLEYIQNDASVLCKCYPNLNGILYFCAAVAEGLFVFPNLLSSQLLYYVYAVMHGCKTYQHDASGRHSYTGWTCPPSLSLSLTALKRWVMKWLPNNSKLLEYTGACMVYVESHLKHIFTYFGCYHSNLLARTPK